jgi:LuxR family maltose regulon positive regulatory protein
MRSIFADSKVVVPPLPPRYIPRPRLLDALDEALSRPLTLLSAGPGSGKTVLLSSWVRQRSETVAWLSLDKNDGAPSRFWPLLFRALHGTVEVDPDAGVAPALLGTDDMASDIALNSLAAALQTASESVLMVLDDAHVLDDPTVLEALDSLIRHDLPNFRLVLASRRDPFLPLHRYRLAGSMAEFRANELALTKAETRELLAVHDVSLTPQELALLTSRTEGWAAGVRLSAMRMAGSDRPAEFITELALDQGSVGEYLIDEVLDRQPVQIRRFLIETSVLDEVSGPLADAVTQQSGGADLLAQLARENAFVIALNRNGSSYRYHQLFAEILHYLLRREQPAAIGELNRRAARWYDEQGDVLQALHHAVEAEDWSHVCALLDGGGYAKALVHRQDLVSTGLPRLLDVEATTAMSEVELVETDAAKAVVAALTGQPARATAYLASVAEMQNRSPELVPAHASTTADLVKMRLASHAGDAAEVARVAEHLLGSGDDADANRQVAGLDAAVSLEEGTAFFWDGNHEPVEALLLESIDRAREASAVVLELEAVSMLALFHASWARFGNARRQEALAVALVRRHPQLATLTSLHMAIAARAHQQSDLVTMAKALRRATATSLADPGSHLPAALTLQRAWLLLASGKPGDAQHLLARSRPLKQQLPRWLEVQRTATLAEVDIELGRPQSALQRLREDPTGLRAPMRAVALTRAYLVLGDLRRAEKAVREVLTNSGSLAPRASLLDALLLEAEIAIRRQDESQAVASAVHAIELSLEDDLALPFQRARKPLTTLLDRHPSIAAAWPGHLVSEAQPAELASDLLPGSPGTLPEPLTERERAVLRWLATSMSTAEIAQELCLSVNTVKTHVAAIYRKLAVARRREAVMQARVLELL